MWSDNEPKVGRRVRVCDIVRSLAGEPGYGTMPGDAPGTVAEVCEGMTMVSTTTRVLRVRVEWDDPQEVASGRFWRVADLEPA